MLARLLLLGGLVAFAVGVLCGHQRETWSIVLVNHLFWFGLAQGGVAWAATLQLARARWSRPVNEVGLAFVAYLPLATLSGALLYFGRESLLPWLGQDLGDRAGWLSVPFLFARDAGGTVALTVLSIVLVRCSARAAREREDGLGHGRDVSALSIALLLSYVLVFTLISFDLVMGLKPFWHSTLFGLYFISGAMLAAMAAMLLALRFLGARPDSRWHMAPSQWLDASNLLLTFVMLTTYMFFAHLLGIWYADLPAETVFLTDRWHSPVWRPVVVFVMAGFLMLPFLLLTVRELKQRPRLMVYVAALVLVSAFVERYLLVVPSLFGGRAPFGFVGVFVTLGYAGAFVLSLAWYLNRTQPASSHAGDEGTLPGV